MRATFDEIIYFKVYWKSKHLTFFIILEATTLGLALYLLLIKFYFDAHSEVDYISTDTIVICLAGTLVSYFLHYFHFTLECTHVFPRIGVFIQTWKLVGILIKFSSLLDRAKGSIDENIFKPVSSQPNAETAHITSNLHFQRIDCGRSRCEEEIKK